MPVSENLIMAIAATAELCGKVYSPAAARMLASDLEGFPEHAVLAALTRCRKELGNAPFNVSAITTRIEDGHPGVEEAWALMPMDETQTVVWTPQMSNAFAQAKPLLDSGDRIAARMVFKEQYTKALTLARDKKIMAKFTPSLGSDRSHQESILRAAVEYGRLTVDHVKGLVPALQAESNGRVLIGNSGPTAQGRQALDALQLQFKPKMFNDQGIIE